MINKGKIDFFHKNDDFGVIKPNKSTMENSNRPVLDPKPNKVK